MKPHKHAEVLHAIADGIAVQWTAYLDRAWMDYDEKTHGSPIQSSEFSWRIKPPEVPQWRKDMAKALEEGKEVQYHHGQRGWIKTINMIEQFLDAELQCSEEDYRIKPEPKPDVVDFICVARGYGGTVLSTSDNNLVLTFDGETGKLKSAEVLK